MKNFFIPLLTIALITSGLAATQAFADQDPGTCSLNAPFMSIGVFRDTLPAGPGPEDTTPVILSSSPSGQAKKADIGEQVIYRVDLKKTDAGTECNYEEGIDLIENLCHYYDEPFADSSAIPSMLLAKYTRQHVTVALSGDGGDESFCTRDCEVQPRDRPHSAS